MFEITFNECPKYLTDHLDMHSVYFFFTGTAYKMPLPCIYLDKNLTVWPYIGRFYKSRKCAERSKIIRKRHLPTSFRHNYK